MRRRFSQDVAVAAIGALFAAAALMFFASSGTLERQSEAARVGAQAQSDAGGRLEAARAALERVAAALSRPGAEQEPEPAFKAEAEAALARQGPFLRGLVWFQAVESAPVAEAMAQVNAEGLAQIAREGAGPIFLPARLVARDSEAPQAFPWTGRDGRLAFEMAAGETLKQALGAAVSAHAPMFSPPVLPGGKENASFLVKSSQPGVILALRPLFAEMGGLRGVAAALIDAGSLASAPGAIRLSGPFPADSPRRALEGPGGVSLMFGAASPWSATLTAGAQRFELEGAVKGAGIGGVGFFPLLMSLIMGAGVAGGAWTLLSGERSRGEETARDLKSQEAKFRRNLAKLRQSEERFRQLAESTGVIPWAANLNERRFTYIGPQIEAMTGYPANSWYAVGFWVDHVHPEDRHKVIVEGMRKLKPQEHATFEYRLRTASGRVVHVRNMMTLLPAAKGEEKPSLAQGYMLDVTEIKIAERRLEEARAIAEESNKTKSDFLANMSHELRTPLNAVIGFSEVMKDQLFGPLDARYRDYAENIHTSGRHLLSLINDVLDLSKIEAGRIELIEQDVDVAALLASCRTLLHDRATSAGLHIRTEIPKPLPPVRADERRLKQVILNLMSNAVKFTLPGGRLTLRAEVLDPRGLRVAVTDTGIGMTPEEIEVARSQFGQIDSDLARQHDGTGLGLPIAESLVKLHGGELEIQSKKGVGTSVIIWLPLIRVGRVPREAAPAPRDREKKAG